MAATSFLDDFNTFVLFRTPKRLSCLLSIRLFVAQFALYLFVQLERFLIVTQTFVSGIGVLTVIDLLFYISGLSLLNELLSLFFEAFCIVNELVPNPLLLINIVVRLRCLGFVFDKLLLDYNPFNCSLAIIFTRPLIFRQFVIVGLLIIYVLINAIAGVSPH